MLKGTVTRSERVRKPQCAGPQCDRIGHMGSRGTHWCNVHYAQILRGETPTPIVARTTSERFWAKVNKDGPTQAHMDTPCWVWTASRIGKGYGQFRAAIGGGFAHRYSWECANGPLPEGMIVLHRCDNPLCIRPDHLLAGSYQDNYDDMVNKGRRRQCHGERHQSAKLTEDMVQAIRAARRQGASVTTLAATYGVGETTIRNAAAGITWSHMTS